MAVIDDASVPDIVPGTVKLPLVSKKKTLLPVLPGSIESLLLEFE